MTSEQWKEITPILQEALEFDVVDRHRFLFDRVPNQEIRLEIESLLRFEEASRDLLEVSASEFAGEMLADAAPSPMVDRSIGNYVIESELGIGGMGAVYSARRADGKFERRVAVKMLRREYNSARLRRRFEFEKDIQAQLLHPNIAELLDAGTADDGIPFIVMEYIDGTPIDRYCAEKELSLRDRLKLFNKACDAVSFAHRRLVVHRDLKPSNILVNKEGEPKLLDFGISKLVGSESDVDHTVTNFRVMTPQYASPEQLNGLPVTTSTDVYSLGVILFKILTGTYPYDLTGKANGDGIREITNSSAQLPSEAVERQMRQRRSGSETHNSAIHASQLKGDIDRIVSKAIRLEPENRYESVEQFSADIWRYLDGHPVIARSPTFSYQAQKFFARNRIAVIAGAAVLIALLAGIGVAISQARTAQKNAVAAKGEQDKSEKISKFMFRILSYANPRWYAEGAKSNGNARVIDVMFELSDRIDAEFANEPDVAAELHHRFAEVLLSYPEAQERARFHLRRALELRKSYYGDWHELVAKDMYYFSVAGLVETEKRANYLYDAIEMMRATNPKNLNLPYMIEDYVSRMLLPQYKAVNDQFARVLTERTGRDPLEAAEDMTIEADQVFRVHFDDTYPAIAVNKCRLAYLKLRLGKFSEAVEPESVCRDAANKAQLSSPFLDEIDKLKPPGV